MESFWDHVRRNMSREYLVFSNYDGHPESGLPSRIFQVLPTSETETSQDSSIRMNEYFLADGKTYSLKGETAFSLRHPILDNLSLLPLGIMPQILAQITQSQPKCTDDSSPELHDDWNRAERDYDLFPSEPDISSQTTY